MIVAAVTAVVALAAAFAARGAKNDPLFWADTDEGEQIARELLGVC